MFEETDERFFAGVWLTRSERYLVISTSSKLTSEDWLLDAGDPTGELSVVAPRRQGVEYSVDHQVSADGTDRLLILHNDGAENFEIATATLDDPAAWTPLVPHRADTRLMDVGAFRDHLVVYFRGDGLTGLRVLRADGIGARGRRSASRSTRSRLARTRSTTRGCSGSASSRW